MLTPSSKRPSNTRSGGYRGAYGSRGGAGVPVRRGGRGALSPTSSARLNRVVRVAANGDVCEGGIAEAVCPRTDRRASAASSPDSDWSGARSVRPAGGEIRCMPHVLSAGLLEKVDGCALYFRGHDVRQLEEGLFEVDELPKVVGNARRLMTSTRSSKISSLIASSTASVVHPASSTS